MSTQTLIPFLREISALPAAQREVLVPLVAWQLSVENPAFELTGELGDAVVRFIESLGSDLESVHARLEERLCAVGISRALIQGAFARATIPALPSQTFEARRPPAAGQVRGALALLLRGAK
jgi:hypothetical protein